jgi:osmoprotectant transport system ATP-binding protein
MFFPAGDLRQNPRVIEIEGLGKRFGDTVAVADLWLGVARGELVALVGASGCGKTTTLKMVNRLIEPSAGRVVVGGLDTESIPAHELRRRIGYAFQRVGLFPHMSVAENVAVTPSLLRWEPGRTRRRVDELLELVELDPGEYRERRPEELSGGQQQRVGLARALAARPEVLLLDEPFGALDPPTRDRLQQSFVRIRRELGLTVLFVTHDMAEALLLADRVAVLDAGRLVQVGPPGLLLREPATGLVAELVSTPRRHAEAVERLLEATP